MEAAHHHRGRQAGGSASSGAGSLTPMLVAQRLRDVAVAHVARWATLGDSEWRQTPNKAHSHREDRHLRKHAHFGKRQAIIQTSAVGLGRCGASGDVLMERKGARRPGQRDVLKDGYWQRRSWVSTAPLARLLGGRHQEGRFCQVFPVSRSRTDTRAANRVIQSTGVSGMPQVCFQTSAVKLNQNEVSQMNFLVSRGV